MYLALNEINPATDRRGSPTMLSRASVRVIALELMAMFLPAMIYWFTAVLEVSIGEWALRAVCSLSWLPCLSCESILATQFTSSNRGLGVPWAVEATRCKNWKHLEISSMYQRSPALNFRYQKKSLTFHLCPSIICLSEKTHFRVPGKESCTACATSPPSRHTRPTRQGEYFVVLRVRLE